MIVSVKALDAPVAAVSSNFKSTSQTRSATGSSIPRRVLRDVEPPAVVDLKFCSVDTVTCHVVRIPPLERRFGDADKQMTGGSSDASPRMLRLARIGRIWARTSRTVRCREPDEMVSWHCGRSRHAAHINSSSLSHKANQRSAAAHLIDSSTEISSSTAHADQQLIPQPQSLSVSALAISVPRSRMSQP